MGLKILAKEKGVTLEEVFERLLRIPELAQKSSWPTWTNTKQEEKLKYLAEAHQLQNDNSKKALSLLYICDYEAMKQIPSLIWIKLRRDGLINNENKPRITNKGHDYIAKYGLPKQH